MRRTLISTAVLLCLAGLTVEAQAAKAKPKARPAKAAAVEQATTQLPRTARPLHYEVSITPDVAGMQYTGHAAITVEVLQPTAEITLHALDMRFAAASLANERGNALNAVRVALNEKEQTASFHFGRLLARGTYRLILDYSGKIGTQAAGLFAVDYTTTEGKKRALYTQFENSDARRVIPSWDEPGFKTTFTLELAVPKGEMAVSNMPVERSTALADGRSLVRFARTPRMSTYLVFLGLGDFERATAMEGATELGVVTKRGATGQAAFALESSAAVLREYNDYFGVRYPLPKLDNVAAPGRSQFFSAMENWGAIFSFEYSILLDPAISTQADKQRAFQVAAHEIAHQWFGNLVTMRWWDDLWLNEGFASWMESRTTELLHPEWNTRLQAVESRERAMSQDALKTTHSVVQKIATVEQASQAFDDITYEKGQAVIRMLEAYVGPEAFRNGVREYMKQHAYGNTASDDLWNQIQRAAGKPVTAIAHDFTLQPGVPLVRVDASCAKGSTTLRLTQGEFSKDFPDKKPLRWRVPVIVQPVDAKRPGSAPISTLIENGKAVLTVPGCQPLVVNAGQSGYYRTVYQPEHFAALAKSFASLAPVDQYGFLSDSWSLGLAGVQPAGWTMDLIKAAPVAGDPQVWGKIAGILAYLDLSYGGDTVRRAALRKFAIATLTPVMRQVGWIATGGELDTVGILRNDLIRVLGALGDESVVNEARRRYAAFATDASALPGNLRSTIMGVVAYHADAATWDLLHAAAKEEKTPLIKDQLYGLLAATADPLLAQRALAMALTPEPGETNSAAMLSRVAAKHPDMAFDFAVANVAVVNTKVDASSQSRFFPGLANASADPAMPGKLRAYANAHLAPTARGEMEAAISTIQYRIKVRKEQLPSIDAWLRRNGA